MTTTTHPGPTFRYFLTPHSRRYLARLFRTLRASRESAFASALRSDLASAIASACVCEVDPYEISDALHNLAADYHSGQWSNGYLLLSVCPGAPGIDGVTADIYTALVANGFAALL